MKSILFFTFLISCFSTQAASDCANKQSTGKLYQLFKSYRLAVNKAKDLVDLENYFSRRYKAYFINHINSAAKSQRSHWLEQYWNNLTIAGDIVSVYGYRSICRKNRSILELLSVVTGKTPKIGETLALWRVEIQFIREKQQWLIDGIEYQQPTGNAPRDLPLLDNFSLISVM